MSVKPSSSYATGMLVVLLANIPLCFVMIGLLLLMPIGAWQVIDALYRVLYGDRRRVPYLIVVALYLSLLYGMTTYSSSLGSSSFLEIVILLPYCIAFWYWYLTWQHAKESEEEMHEHDEDILDEGA